MTKKEDIAIRALEEIVRLDFNKNEDGSTNFHSGAPRFVAAWLFAQQALDKLKVLGWRCFGVKGESVGGLRY